MLKAYIETCFASMLWGFGFVATIWALQSMGPLWITAIRFLLCAIAIDLFYRIKGSPLKYDFKNFRAIFLPGLFLFGLLGLQTAGLKFTTATKSGFITVLYVLIVPFFERIAMGNRIRPIIFLWIVLALAGTAMICGAWTADGISDELLKSFNWGDALTLLCAFAGAAHFVSVSIKLKVVESPVVFHIYQSLWVFLFAAATGFFSEGLGWIHAEWSNLAIFGLLFLAFFSSSIAFLIQVRAQRLIPPSTMGLIMLLESPWALIFSVWLMHEHLTAYQIAGAVLILIAAIAESMSLATRPQN